MSQRDFVDLVESVASELQRLYSTSDINLYLTRFGVVGATQKSVPSKRTYVKELLSAATDQSVIRIAEDLELTGAAAARVRVVSPNRAGLTPRTQPYAFISYQHEDRDLAGKLKRLFDRIDIPSFLAHEDIEVSDEWRARLLDEMSKVTMFIAVLTARYFGSVWCAQESGIAAYRDGLVIVPLSFDGTNPQGFLSHYQAKKVDSQLVALRDLLPGFLRQDRSQGLDIAVRIVSKSMNYRDAEANFEALLPHLDSLSASQMKALLECAVSNDQVQHASKCATQYLPPLIKAHGKLLDPDIERRLRKACENYGAAF